MTETGKSTSLQVLKNQDGTIKSWEQLSHPEQERYGSEAEYQQVIERFNKEQGFSSSEQGNSPSMTRETSG
jgi:hypothetical protein